MISVKKFSPEHRQTALRLGFGRFVLQNIPVLREHVIGDADDIGSDPIPRPSGVGKAAMDNYVIAFGNDRARLVLERRAACS